MLFNDVERGRHSLAAAISADEGATWKWKRHLDGNSAQAGAIQDHYPSVIQAKDGSIHVTYSYFVADGKSIKHGRFTEDWAKAERTPATHTPTASRAESLCSTLPSSPRS